MRTVQQLFDLSGQIALITGGSRGLGREIAEGMAEAGASLMLLARREQWLTPTVEELRQRGFRCEGLLCDAAVPEQIESAVARTLEIYGKIEILVNNAGVSWGAPAETMALDKWRMVIDVNLTGAFLFCQAVGRQMIERGGGRIVNISSINALTGGLLMSDVPNASYVASKGGLTALTRELAAKWARHGIRVNAIAPGYFPTRMSERIWERVQVRAEQQVPMGRGGKPDELKGVALFLASDASNYITGQTIVVDGGTTLV
jgi:NAD(P)-dependent dehydrogenase (short-subunit alcohol dehydrogenase family)